MADDIKINLQTINKDDIQVYSTQGYQNAECWRDMRSERRSNDKISKINVTKDLMYQRSGFISENKYKL